MGSIRVTMTTMMNMTTKTKTAVGRGGRNPSTGEEAYLTAACVFLFLLYVAARMVFGVPGDDGARII